MPRAYQQGDEPVRGYRLVRFLGKGGFGEVWQATGPGGTEVAFKIIRLEDKPGLKEFRSVELVKKIRHPNLVPIIAIWIRDGGGLVTGEGTGRDRPSWPGNAPQIAHTLAEFSLDAEMPKPEALFIAMGLGDKSLLDRFKECKDQEQSGIPPGELIGYLEDAARAIDHLNSPKHDLGQGPVAIQHCDIKPQNILIVGGAAQVCDFGLARVLGETRSASHPGVTVAFAAPEMFEAGQPSSYSDQYSLAITYYYLRTGALPFSMNESNVVLTEAMEGRLDLSRLPTAEQQIIRRATSRRPEARYTNCQDMTRELRRAIERSGGVAAEGLVIEPDREIVPGHRLIRLLGRGAFGEVWEAQAPGRLPVALKIIKDIDRASGRGRQEFRALEIIQKVSHQGLMELRAYWLLDRHGQLIPDDIRGQAGSPVPATLIIATRLADKTLTEILEQYREQGKPGIPPRELVGYLRQVALALDYLNSATHRMGDRRVAVQHRDVKPDNIMLADDVVKLTDFGLAKVMETEDITAEIRQDSVGFTFHYAAPEVLRGKVTKWSDQYSLAITYFQLRTGVLPYGAECSAYDQMMRQLEGQLDLSAMPPTERAIIARATSVIPEERFPSCKALIDALAAVAPASAELKPAPHKSIEVAAPSRKKSPPPPAAKHVQAGGSSDKDPLTELSPVVIEATKERPTMQVALVEGEIYPDPVGDMSALGETPALADTDHDTPHALVAAQGQPVAQTQVGKARSQGRRYALYAAVFIVGIGMAMIVHFGLKSMRSHEQASQEEQSPVHPTTTDPATTEPVTLPVPTKPQDENKKQGEVKKPDDPPVVVANNKKSEIDARPVPPMSTTPPELGPTPPVKMEPKPVLLFGKNVKDSDFGTFLSAHLDKLISSTNKPAEFTLAWRELDPVPLPYLSQKLLAFRAECLIEGEAKNMSQADVLVKQSLNLEEPSAYCRYVQARLYYEQGDVPKAAQELGEALKRDVSLAGFRRDRAATILTDAAGKLPIAMDAKALRCQLGAPAPGWLDVIGRVFDKRAQLPTALALPMAVHAEKFDDAGMIDRLLTPAFETEWLQKPQGAVLLTALRLKSAEAKTQTQQPEAALASYADAWSTIQKHRDQFDAAGPLELHARVIQPGIKLAEKTKESPERNTQLSALHAALGALIFEAPYEAWPIPADKPALRIAAESYTQAARLFPGTGRVKAEYLTGGGQCLNRLGTLAPEDLEIISKDAQAATTADPTYAGGWNLMGLAKYYRIAQESNQEQLQSTLRESLDAYDKAVTFAQQANPGDRMLAVYRSNRSLAKSMLGDFTPKDNDRQRKLYEDAGADAQQAVKIDSTYESAWGALGQARERLADVSTGPQAKALYSEAVAAYRRQLEARPSLAQGHAYLGRCLVRWALDEKNSLDRLEEARVELQKAIKLDGQLAEAHFWTGRLHLAKKEMPLAQAAFLQAAKHPSLGMNYFNQTLALYAEQPSETLALVNQYLPGKVEDCQARHASLLVLRSSMTRRTLNLNASLAEAKPALDRSMLDARTALKLAPATEVKVRAEAQESIATIHLVLFVRSEDEAAKKQHRQSAIEEIRSLLESKSTTPGTWELASYLARFLDQDAVDASAEEGQKLRQEAIKALEVSLTLAPAAQKDQLRRLRNDIQSKLRGSP